MSKFNSKPDAASELRSGVGKRDAKAEAAAGRELTDDELDAVAAAGTEDGRARGATDGT